MSASLPSSLVLVPVSRRPTKLRDETTAAVLAFALPEPVGAAIPTEPPRLSVVVLTRNNLVFLKLCLGSLLSGASGLALEILVVDNASSDGTAEYLDAVSRRDTRVRIVKNAENVGFARGNNQALAQARGEVFLLLNDDTIVPPGALDRLCAYAAAPEMGMIGAVSNRAGNEAQVDVPCATYGELLESARHRAASHAGQVRDLPMVTMFAAALRRDVYETVGPLDEEFEIGMFEDDDYALRLRLAGYRVACADDVFVYHFGQTSLGKLAADGRFGSLFAANRARFEAKWGETWTPHRHRVSADYTLLADRLRDLIADAVEPAGVVAVVSRGDNSLLDLPGRVGWHFPQTDDGTYLGYNPASSEDAIAWLDAIRARGAQYLLVPRTALWWLEYYDAFGRHLRARCRVMIENDDAVLFALVAA